MRPCAALIERGGAPAENSALSDAIKIKTVFWYLTSIHLWLRPRASSKMASYLPKANPNHNNSGARSLKSLVIRASFLRKACGRLLFYSFCLTIGMTGARAPFPRILVQPFVRHNVLKVSYWPLTNWKLMMPCTLRPNVVRMRLSGHILFL